VLEEDDSLGIDSLELDELLLELSDSDDDDELLCNDSDELLELDLELDELLELLCELSELEEELL
jgi:hypothetical protein